MIIRCRTGQATKDIQFSVLKSVDDFVKHIISYAQFQPYSKDLGRITISYYYKFSDELINYNTAHNRIVERNTMRVNRFRIHNEILKFPSR